MSTTTDTTDLVTRLYSSRPAHTATRGISPRAAYQDLLHERSVLLDARPAGARAAQGEVAGHLAPLVLGATFAPHQIIGERIILLSTDAAASEAVREVLLRAGAAAVDVLLGGFASWAAAGMPVARPVRSALPGTPRAA